MKLRLERLIVMTRSTYVQSGKEFLQSNTMLYHPTICKDNRGYTPPCALRGMTSVVVSEGPH
jgi:hypothetical protein